MTLYRVRQWEKFQHYKDRNPPWIRLYKGLLDDYEFHCLPVASKALAPLLWLLASESKDPASGVIEGTDERIVFRLHMTIADFHKAIKPLITHRFIECLQAASTSLAEHKQPATPETETETERERVSVKRTRVTLEDLSVNHISDWLAKKRGQGKYLLHDEHFILDYFKNYCTSKGQRYDDYPHALRNAFEWNSCQPKNSDGGRPTKSDRAKAAIVAGLQEYRAGLGQPT